VKWILCLLIISLLLLSGCQTEAPRTTEAPATVTTEPARLSISPEAARNASIEVVPVRREIVEGQLEAPGRLTWNDDRTVSVGVVATGRVVHVYAKAGDMVKEGQLLARMHTHDVHDTKALLRQALAERDRATSALEQAKRTEARMKRLLELKAISQAQLEQAVQERETAESLLRVARASVDKEVAHLEEFLQIPSAVEKTLQEESTQKHEEEDELVPIKAAAKGVIVARRVGPGTVVSVGDEAFVISDPNSLWCMASFPETALARLRVGALAQVQVRAFPGRLFPARIERLGASIDPDTRTLMVQLSLASQGVLKPEMLATVQLREQSSPQLVIPESALQVINGETVVFREIRPGEFARQPVQAMVRDNLAIIQSGLQEGDRVAAGGSYALKSELLKDSSR
jgi:cobalt-zinc-cadmium efflux system membrane fusion protein